MAPLRAAPDQQPRDPGTRGDARLLRLRTVFSTRRRRFSRLKQYAKSCRRWTGKRLAADVERVGDLNGSESAAGQMR